MLVRADVFSRISGFDAEALAVAFNNVDLCLKLRAADHRFVWTPHAVLEHRESVSRGSDLKRSQRARYNAEAATLRAHWGAALDADPFYNPNLTLRDESGGLAYPPRATRPLRIDQNTNVGASARVGHTVSRSAIVISSTGTPQSMFKAGSFQTPSSASLL